MPGAMIRKVRLATRIWVRFATVRLLEHRVPLPALVARLTPPSPTRQPEPIAALSRAVSRTLNMPPFRTRCLHSALVLYRLLAEQGVTADLVIGLPRDAADHAAHAWVEVDGRDVGPAPGRNGHVELTRYSGRSPRPTP